MSNSLTKPILPTSGRNKRRIARLTGVAYFKGVHETATPHRQSTTNQAHGKMRRAGVYATRKRT